MPPTSSASGAVGPDEAASRSSQSYRGRFSEAYIAFGHAVKRYTRNGSQVTDEDRRLIVDAIDTLDALLAEAPITEPGHSLIFQEERRLGISIIDAYRTRNAFEEEVVRRYADVMAATITKIVDVIPIDESGPYRIIDLETLRRAP